MRLKFTFLGLLFFVVLQAKEASLVIFYRPDCPYCLKLDQEIEGNFNLSSQIKKNFNVSTVDITTPEGKEIASFYGVSKVPTLIKYDSKNQNFETFVGYQKGDVLKNILFNKEVPKKVNSASICGDAIVEAPEGCDDGNMSNGDGCSNMCTVESGWSCTGTTSICTRTAVCGNGIKEATEGCDDGNMSNGDGCSNMCTIESGWNCTGTTSICTRTAVCGNGIKEATEGCDDGNLSNGDGCSNMCTVESGWNCNGNPSICTNTLAIDDISREGVFNLNIGSNPVTEKLTLHFFLTKKNNLEISIIDFTGKQVSLTKNKNLTIGNNIVEVNFKKKLPPGNYIINLKFDNDENFKIISKQIIVK